MFHASSLEAHLQSTSAAEDHIGQPTASQAPPCGVMAEPVGTRWMLIGNRVLYLSQPALVLLTSCSSVGLYL